MMVRFGETGADIGNQRCDSCSAQGWVPCAPIMQCVVAESNIRCCDEISGSVLPFLQNSRKNIDLTQTGQTLVSLSVFIHNRGVRHQKPEQCSELKLVGVDSFGFSSLLFKSWNPSHVGSYSFGNVVLTAERSAASSRT